MSEQVLRVTLNKKATVRLDFHFRGSSCVQISRAQWKSSAALEKQLGLFLVLENGADQFMLTEIGPPHDREGVKELDIRSYNNFSLKLAVINENETTEVEHKEESCKDSESLTNDLHVNILCKGTNSVISQECPSAKHVTYIQSFKMNLTCSDQSFNLRNFSEEQNQFILLSEAYLVPPSSNGPETRCRQVFLNLFKDDAEFAIAKFLYPQNDQRTKLDIFLPRAAFMKLSQKQIQQREDDWEKKDESSASNAANSNISLIEIKLLLHAVFPGPAEFTRCFSNYFILRQSMPLHINLSDRSYQQVDSITINRIFVSSEKQQMCNRSVVSVKFAPKSPLMILDDVKGCFLTHRINETLSGPSFSLSICLHGEDDETSSSADQVIGLLTYSANFKPCVLKSPSSQGVYTDVDVDYILNDFNRIRDKFRNDIVFMREKNLFECDTLLIGDSILRSVDPSLLLQSVYVQSLGGCTIEELKNILGVLKLANLKRLIVHIGVNNTHGYNNRCNVGDEAAKYHQLLATCRRKAPNAKIFLSGIVARFDKTYCAQWVTNLNRELIKIAEQDPELTFINNFSVTYDQFGNKIGANLAHDNLHISYQGTTALLKSINHVTKISDQPSLQFDQEPYTSSVQNECNQGDLIGDATPPLIDQLPFKQTYFYQNGAASTAVETSTCKVFNKTDAGLQKATSKKKKRAAAAAAINLSLDVARSGEMNESNRSSFSTFSALSSSVEDFLSGIEPLDDKGTESNVSETRNSFLSMSKPTVDNEDQLLGLTSSTESDSKDLGPLSSTMTENNTRSTTASEPPARRHMSSIGPLLPTGRNSSNQYALSVKETNSSLGAHSITTSNTNLSTSCSVDNSIAAGVDAAASKAKWNYRQPHNDSNGMRIAGTFLDSYWLLSSPLRPNTNESKDRSEKRTASLTRCQSTPPH